MNSGTTMALTHNITTTAGTTVKGIITQTAGTIAGSVIIDGGSAALSQSGTGYISGNVSLLNGGALSLGAGSGGIAVNGTINGGGTVTFNASTATGGLIGGGTPVTSLIVAGSSTLTVNHSIVATSLSFSGSGTVSIADAQNLTAAVTTSSHGTGTLTLLGTTTVAGQVGTTAVGLAAINAGANGKTAIFSNNVYTKAINVTGTGTVTFQGVVDAGNADTLTIGGPGDLTLSSIVGAHTGALTKTGAGTLTLSGNNTYTGTTTITAGTLTASGGLAVPSTSSVSVGGTGTLNLTTSQAIGRLDGVSGSKVTVNGNTLTVGVHGVASGTVGDGSGTFAGVISGSGGLTKEGLGVLTLTGANTYTGNTLVNQGTLTIGNGGSIARLDLVTIVAGATFNSGSGAVAVDSIAGSGSTTVSSGGLTVGGTSTTSTYTGALDGTGTFAKEGTGTLTLSGDNSAFSGNTSVTAGTLIVTNVFGDGTKTVTVTGGTLTNNGTVNGAVNVGAGGTLAGSGTIKGAVAVAAGSTVHPGNSPGILTWNNSPATPFAGDLSIDIDGSAAGNGAGFHGQLNGTGTTSIVFNAATSTLSPNLRGYTIGGLAYASTYTPAIGQGFTIVRTDVANGISGTFSATTPNAATQTLLNSMAARFDVAYNSNSIVLYVTPSSYANIGATGNQKAVGTTLQAIRPAPFARAVDSDSQTVWNSIYGLGTSGLQTALDQISGSTIAGAANAAVSTGALINSSLLGRANHNRVLAQTGINDTGVSGGDPTHGWAAWVQPVGKLSSVNKDNNGIGFDSRSYGMLSGRRANRWRGWFYPD
ncbi:hypothetical protein WCLP8_5500001 [uncultured Gammaproteobacteria bacterium]